MTLLPKPNKRCYVHHAAHNECWPINTPTGALYYGACGKLFLKKWVTWGVDDVTCPDCLKILAQESAFILSEMFDSNR